MPAQSRVFVSPTEPSSERSGRGNGLTCTANNKNSAQGSDHRKTPCAVRVSRYSKAKWLPKPAPPTQLVSGIPLGNGLFKPKAARTEKRKALYTCKHPTQLQMKTGQVFWLPCRRCVCCRGNKTNDLTGKMIAESLSCWDVWFWTLTYDDARIADQEINPTQFRRVEHVQNFVNAIRMQCKRATGYKLDAKYFAVYEKGEQRKRGHWHVMLFWKTDVPKDVLASGSVGRAMAENQKPAWIMKHSRKALDPERFKQVQNDPETVELRGGRKAQQYVSAWPHGRVTVESLFRGRSPKANIHSAMAYVVKYVTKEPQRYLCSHRMGQEYFDALVYEQIGNGLQLNELQYSFADQFKMPTYKDRLKERNAMETGGAYVAKDRRRVYAIQGVARDRCIRYAVRLYRSRVKNSWRERLARTGETVRARNKDIRNEMRLERIGQEPVIRRWERQAWNTDNAAPNLERLQHAANIAALIADEIQAESAAGLERARDIYRPKDHDYFNALSKKRREILSAHGLPVPPEPDYAQAIGPVRALRENAIMRRKGAKPKRRTG